MKASKEKNVSAKDYLVLGKVGRAHGLKGDFFVSGRDEPVPLAYGEILVGDSVQTARVAKILQSRQQGDRVVLRCSLAQNRDEAEALTGRSLFVRATAARDEAGSTWLWADLEGANVRAVDGALMGVVRQVYNAGSSDIVEVVNDRGHALDIPVIDDYFDLSAKPRGGEITLKVAATVFEGLWDEKP